LLKPAEFRQLFSAPHSGVIKYLFHIKVESFLFS
jgi:hypothetical protein